MKYIGYSKISECNNFFSWLKYECRDSMGYFIRVFGFEFHSRGYKSRQ